MSRSSAGQELHLPHRAEHLPACAGLRSCHARTRFPTAGLGQPGSSAQDAFHRSDARHCCQAGLPHARVSASARSPSTLTARSAPAPPSRGAADPCCPTRSPPPLRATKTTRGRCLSPTSATDQPYEHPQNRWTPSHVAPCGAAAWVEARLTPALQASAALSALSSKGEEHRTGPALP
jgi:hypothetical protein